MSDLSLSAVETVIPDTGGVTTSSGTVADLIEQARQHLYTGGREKRNKLSSAIDDATETIPLTYPTGQIQEGARISVELEDMYVWASSGTSATAQRGQFGSTASAHPANAVVVVNAKFSDNEIFKALQAELLDLSSPSNGLFRVRVASYTYSPLQIGYDLDVVDVSDVLEVRRKHHVTSTREWPLIQNWELIPNMDSHLSGVDHLLHIYDYVNPGETFVVHYKAPFGEITSLTQNVVEATGLPVTALDILPLGAAVRVAAGREIRRNFVESQPDPRRADEVPAGANLNAPQRLAVIRAQRIQAEAARLNQRYPPRHRRYGW